MTTVAANSFSSSHLTLNNRDSGTRRDVRSATQLTRLQRTGNLTDWKSTYADVQLLPVSCIDSYTNLVIDGNPVPLLPADNSSVQFPANGEHSVLVTRHPTEKLRLRCRKLEVESSPNNNTAHYKLFLAAGFVAYQSLGETKRAPILLIPITIERMRGRDSHYAIKYQNGTRLHVNPQVADLCSTHLEPLIKPFESTTDLREYLRNIKSKVHSNFNCKITANTGLLSLQSDILNNLSQKDMVDIELERTKPGTEFRPLPATTREFDPQLAMRILRFVEPEELVTELHNFSGQTQNTKTPVDDVDPDLDDETLEKYHNCAGWLIDVGLGHWKLKHIAALPRRIRTIESSINKLLANNEFNRLFRNEYRTVDMLFRLNKAKDKILNAPPEMQHHSISLHANANTRLLLQQAKIQASSIEHEMEVIDDTFHLSSVPSSKTLHRLIEIISRRESESQLANPDYFRARRKLNEILRYHNGVLTDGDLERLKSLAKTLQFSETFNDDPYYKRHFGSLFKGTDTNWQRLDTVVNFNHSLSLELGSSLLVAQFSDEWVSFERDFSSFAPNIESAASSAHKLCALIPMFIDKETKLDKASRVAEKFRCRIDVWQKYLHKHFADTELTPMQLLSNMELGDHSYPTVTLSQQQIDERIYRHIVGRGLSNDSVAATADWLLNVIVGLQTDTATVRRFLDKEAVLHRSLS